MAQDHVATQRCLTELDALAAPQNLLTGTSNNTSFARASQDSLLEKILRETTTTKEQLEVKQQDTEVLNQLEAAMGGVESHYYTSGLEGAKTFIVTKPLSFAVPQSMSIHRGISAFTIPRPISAESPGIIRPLASLSMKAGSFFLTGSGSARVG